MFKPTETIMVDSKEKFRDTVECLIANYWSANELRKWFEEFPQAERYKKMLLASHMDHAEFIASFINEPYHYDGSTILYNVVSMAKHAEVVQLFLDLGGDPEVCDKNGNTPLHDIFDIGNMVAYTHEEHLLYMEKIKILVGHNPHILTIKNNKWCTPHEAFKEVVEIIKRRGYPSVTRNKFFEEVESFLQSQENHAISSPK
jgi:hypothetical protein